MELSINKGNESDYDKLMIAYQEIDFLKADKAKLAAELGKAWSNNEKQAKDLIIANKELVFQDTEKGKRAAELGIANKELVFQDVEKGKRAKELGIANKELVFQDEEKGKRAEELIIANKEKEKRAAELAIANKEVVFQDEEKGKRAEELIIANKELVFQNKEKGKRAEELIIANKELVFQNKEKEKRAAELIVTNQELNSSEKSLQNSLKEISDYKYSLDESAIIAITDQKGIIRKVNSNFCKISKYSEQELIGQDHRLLSSGYHSKEFIKELWTTIAKGKIWKGVLKNKAKDGTFYWVDTTIVPFLDEKGKPYQYLAIRVDITDGKESERYLIQRTAELETANKELAFQNGEKEKRAAELAIANTELLFQNEEKEKRAAELIVANKELLFQNEEKEKRAAELAIANKELVFQDEEKGKRAEELIIANKELVFQNGEKEKRAAELAIANKELLFQNEEKEKRAAELIVANEELLFQNEEKEKRAAELIVANKELLAFTYISSHDLQEPLRKIQTFVTIILENENKNLSEGGKNNFLRMQLAAKRMQQLIDDLLAFSRISTTELVFEKIDLNQIIAEVKPELKDTIYEKNATIESSELCTANIIAFQFRQLMYNLLSNALKFSKPDVPSHILIKCEIKKGADLSNEKLSPDKNYCHIIVKDNGIGFEPHFSERIFEVFQKLHGKEIYAGTGIGLAIVKKIVDNHNGIITATSALGQGAKFDIYIPN